MRTIFTLSFAIAPMLACSERQAEIEDTLCAEYRESVEPCEHIDAENQEEQCHEFARIIEDENSDCIEPYEGYIQCLIGLSCDERVPDTDYGPESPCYDINYAMALCMGVVEPDE